MILIETGLRIGGPAYLYFQEFLNKRSLSQTENLRILCIGESTTAMGGKDSYPRQLENILNDRSSKIDFAVINKGVPAINTTYILSNIEKNLHKYDPHIVVAMMGINDTGRRMQFSRDLNNSGQLKTLKIFNMIGLLINNIKERPQEINGRLIKHENKVNSGNPRLLHGSGWKKHEEGDIKTALQLMNKAVNIDKDYTRGYISMGKIYRQNNDFINSEKMYKKAIDIDPADENAYLELGWLYKDLDNFVEAEKMYKKSILLNKQASRPINALGRLYLEYKKHDAAIELLENSLQLFPDNLTALEVLSRAYDDKGIQNMAVFYNEKAQKLRINFPKSTTAGNYNKLRTILDERKIPLICVQYPLCSIEELKNYFKESRNIVFVDNEQSFKKALLNHGYDEYFIDRSFAFFGHCTPRGNRLLAQNIADTILNNFSIQYSDQ
ncbi:tetratricopeptide repeat protein [Elusimicrobiota bacterium]